MHLYAQQHVATLQLHAHAARPCAHQAALVLASHSTNHWLLHTMLQQGARCAERQRTMNAPLPLRLTHRRCSEVVLVDSL